MYAELDTYSRNRTALLNLAGFVTAFLILFFAGRDWAKERLLLTHSSGSCHIALTYMAISGFVCGMAAG